MSAVRSCSALPAFLVLALGPLVCSELQGEEKRTADGKKAPRTDLQGDPLPPGAIARLGTVRLRHSGCARLVAFSPDGKLLASGGSGGIVLWEVATGRQVRHLQGRSHLGAPHAVGHPPEVLAPGDVRRMAFSPNGQYLAAVLGAEIHVWEPATGKLLPPFGEGKEARSNAPEYFIAFCPDNKTLVTGLKNAIRWWDVTTRKEVRRFESPELTSFRALSPDGKTLASGKQDENGIVAIRLWDTAAGKELPRIEGEDLKVDEFAFSPDGQTLATAAGNTIRLWGVATGLEGLRLEGYRSSSSGGSSSLAFSADGKTLAARGAGVAVRLWEVPTGKQVGAFKGHRWDTNNVALSPDGKAVALGTGGVMVRLVDAATGQQLHAFPGHESGASAVAFSPDGRLVASSGGDTICLWEPMLGKHIRQFGVKYHYAYSLAFSPDGKTLLSGGGGADLKIALWEVATGKLLRQFQTRATVVDCVAFSPDGQTFASGGSNDHGGTNVHTIRMFEVGTGKEVRQLRGHEGAVTRVVFSPDGQILASASYDGMIRLWEVASGKELRRIQPGPNPHPLSRLAFFPDGKTLASEAWHHNKGSIRLREAATGKELRRLDGDYSRIYSLAISPSGKTLAAIGDDMTVRVWEVATGKQWQRFDHSAWSVAFSPDGKMLASANLDSTVLVWDLTGQLLAEGVPPSRLTPEERENCWNLLAGTDSAKAHQAIRTLMVTPQQAVALLQERLRPVPSADPPRLARLLAQLDDEQFEVREQASKDLETLGNAVKSALRQALAGPLSAEARRRIEELVAKLEGPLSPDRLRTLRAIEVLEHLGTPGARQVLEALSKGAAGALETDDAKAALKRLS